MFAGGSLLPVPCSLAITVLLGSNRIYCKFDPQTPLELKFITISKISLESNGKLNVSDVPVDNV